MNVPTAVVIHPSHDVWEVWAAGSYGVDSVYGRDRERGTFTSGSDARRFAEAINRDAGDGLEAETVKAEA